MSWFGSEAGQSSISSGINAVLGLGVTAIGSNQQKKLMQGQANAQANLSAQQGRDALALEQERTRQIQMQLQGAKAQTSSVSPTLYIALAVGGVVILGGIIFAVTRK
jgi:hypothetical protein